MKKAFIKSFPFFLIVLFVSCKKLVHIAGDYEDNGIEYVRSVPVYGNRIQGFTIDDSGSLYISSNRAADGEANPKETFRIDKYHSMDTHSKDKEELVTLHGHGQGLDYINGQFYYADLGNILVFDHNMEETMKANLEIKVGNWNTCSGSLEYYVCIEAGKNIHVFDPNLNITNAPIKTFTSDSYYIMNSIKKKALPYLQGIDVYKDFVLIYRGGMVKGEDEYLWIDVHSIKTGKLIYQKRFQVWKTRGISAKLILRHEAEGLTVVGNKVYLGVAFVHVDDFKEKTVSSILVDNKLTTTLDNYIRENQKDPNDPNSQNTEGYTISSEQEDFSIRKKSDSDSNDSLEELSAREIQERLEDMGIKLDQKKIKFIKKKFNEFQASEDKESFNPFSTKE